MMRCKCAPGKVLNTMSVIDLRGARKWRSVRLHGPVDAEYGVGQTGQLPTEEEMLEVVMAVYNLLMTASNDPSRPNRTLPVLQLMS